jgi:hypothetical protein
MDTRDAPDFRSRRAPSRGRAPGVREVDDDSGLSITTSYKIVRDLAPKGEPNKGDAERADSTLRNERAQFGEAEGGGIVGSDVAIFLRSSRGVWPI